MPKTLIKLFDFNNKKLNKTIILIILIQKLIGGT